MTLSLVIQKATGLGLWEGVEISRNGVKLTHLQYADDTIIFRPSNLDYLLNVKKTLILFQLASGLQVNFHKSSIHGIHKYDQWLQKAAKALLCKSGGFPMTYLGLPIGGNMARMPLWDPIVKRIEQKLATWKGRLLSIAGRITLIKASIASLPLYFMSLFPAPKGVIEIINKLQRQFLWSGETGKPYMSLVSWDRVVSPKPLGVLNCGNLLNRNISLMFKWIWRFLNESCALWRNIIQAKYGCCPRLLPHELNIPARRGPWRNICASVLRHPVTSEMLKSKIRRVVGNGLHILFWEEIWVSDTSLKSQFPRLYSITMDSHATISSLGYWSGSCWHWNFSWKCPFRPRDRTEWDELQALLGNICLSTINLDSYAWTPNKSEQFSVKSLSLEMAKSSSQSHSPSFNWKKLWHGLIPPRVEVFTWLALLRNWQI